MKASRGELSAIRSGRLPFRQCVRPEARGARGLGVGMGMGLGFGVAEDKSSPPCIDIAIDISKRNDKHDLL